MASKHQLQTIAASAAEAETAHVVAPADAVFSDMRVSVDATEVSLQASALMAKYRPA
jgi:hypothetical protein